MAFTKNRPVLDRVTRDTLCRIAGDLRLHKYSRSQNAFRYHDANGAASRAAEFIGYYYLRSAGWSPLVKAFMATLILRDLSSAVVADQVCVLAGQFLLATRREWRQHLEGILDVSDLDYSVRDFLETEDPATVARRILSRELRLRFPTMRWARANASADRVQEFVAYYEDNCDDAGDEFRENLGCLIVYSVDDALARECLTPAMRLDASRFLSLRPSLLLDSVTLHAGLSDYFEYFEYGTDIEARRTLSLEFGLEYPALDWAATNAAPDRLPQLLDRYFAGWLTQVSVAGQKCLGEWILASLDQAFRTSVVAPDVLDQVARFVREQHGDQAGNLALWARRGCRKLAVFLSDTILLAENNEVPQQPPSDALYTNLEARYSDGSARCRDWHYTSTYYLECALGFRYPLECAHEFWCDLHPDKARTIEYVRYYRQRATRLRSPAWHFLEKLCTHALNRALIQTPGDCELLACAEAFVGESDLADFPSGFACDFGRVVDAVRKARALGWLNSPQKKDANISHPGDMYLADRTEPADKSKGQFGR